MKRFALLSGIAYLMVFISGFFANFTVLETLVIWDDMAITTHNFIDFHSKFGMGLLGFLTMLLFDLVLVFSLFPLTLKFNKKLTYTASALRMVHTIGFAIGLFGLYNVYRITPNVSNHNLEGLEQMVYQALHNFDTIWTIALVVFGLHLFFLGYLSIRFKAFPKAVGFLLVLAAMGYVVDGAAKLFFPAYDEYKIFFESFVVLTGILGEFTFTIWLLIKGFVGFKEKANAK